MKRKIIKIIFAALFLIMGMTGILMYKMGTWVQKGEDGIPIVLLNEIERITENTNGESPKPQIDELRERIESKTGEAVQKKMYYFLGLEGILTGLCIICIFLYIYFKIIRPFEKLEHFASDIAAGNFEQELHYERENFFGAFTWAFDHMRGEIIRARTAEKAAIDENKTVIATLSHDIKTPIASIYAYAEGLEAGLDKDYEKRAHYLQVIMKKCDEVTALTNDLVLHSLSELSKLNVENQPVHIGELLQQVLKDLEYSFLKIQMPICDGLVMLDQKRFAQVIENILNNAQKYAGQNIVEVWTTCDKENYQIHIADQGDGISPEDMPFIFDKFYRGKNAKNQKGSGLGLYIVKYLCQQMNGDIELHNRFKGLEVTLTFPIVN